MQALLKLSWDFVTSRVPVPETVFKGFLNEFLEGFKKGLIRIED